MVSPRTFKIHVTSLAIFAMLAWHAIDYFYPVFFLRIVPDILTLIQDLLKLVIIELILEPLFILFPILLILLLHLLGDKRSSPQRSKRIKKENICFLLLIGSLSFVFALQDFTLHLNSLSYLNVLDSFFLASSLNFFGKREN